MYFRTSFLGLDFDPLTVDEATQALAWRARKLAPFAYVATPNVDHVVRLDRNHSLRPLYQGAWLNLCDSRILELFAEASNLDLPAAPGADIAARLFERHIRTTDTVLVIGGTASIAQGLRDRYGLRDLRWHDAAMGLADDAAARTRCVEFIRANPAPYVFLAVGSPQQEMIALEAATSGGCSGLALCCGAALEFLTGETRRAPEWMQRRRLEWLHRLATRPARLWKRYLIDGPRIFGIWCRWRTEPAPAFASGPDMAVSPH